MGDLLNAVPPWLLILAGMIGGMCVIALHGFAGYLATKTIKYKITGRAVAITLILAGTVVGTMLSFTMATSAVAADVGYARCAP